MTRIKTLISPLRYPGSKRRLVSFIKEALQINALKPSLFIGPFVGGRSVAINLLNENLVESAILVDINPWITSFWKVVLHDTGWLISETKLT